MKKALMSASGLALGLAAVLILLSSCTGRQPAQLVHEDRVRDLAQVLESDDYVSKVDALVVLLDASSSMDDTAGAYKKIDIAKAFVSRMNRTIPPIQAESGLRSFGHSPEVAREKTRLLFGMAPYSRQGMQQGLDQVVEAGGPTPMAEAISRTTADLESVSGRKAVVIVSDGEDLGDEAVLAAMDMQEKFGSSLCLHTVFVGDTEAGKGLMSRIAGVSDCGSMTVAMDTLPADAMAAYVADRFLAENEKTAEMTEEKTQETVAAEKKQETVAAEKKQEPMGLGYHQPMPDLDNIYFQFDRAELTQEGRTALDNHIETLKSYPDLEVQIEGYASKIGAESYNEKLSRERAKAVQQYLVNQGGISPDRIPIKAYGEQYPAVPEPNPQKIRSPAAKANMRVEFKPKAK